MKFTSLAVVSVLTVFASAGSAVEKSVFDFTCEVVGKDQSNSYDPGLVEFTIDLAEMIRLGGRPETKAVVKGKGSRTFELSVGMDGLGILKAVAAIKKKGEVVASASTPFNGGNGIMEAGVVLEAGLSSLTVTCVAK